MKKRMVILMAGVLGLTTVFTGCSSNSNSGSSTQASSTQSTNSESKELIFGTSQTCYSLDPTSSYDSWYALRYGVGQTLTKFDDKLKPKPWLITEEYSMDDDNLTWNFVIRDDVTFSNGNKLTAEGVKGSIERVFKESDRATSFFSLDSITAEGQNLTIKTKTPCANMLGMLADPLFVIIDTSVDNSEIADKGPICTGPFVFKSFDITSYECVVEKNENYWGDEVKLDTVTFKMFNDATTQSYALQNGEIDAAYNVGMTEIDNYRDNKDYLVSECAGGRTDYGFMNQNGVLKDKTLREAILRSLDKKTYCESLLNNAFVPGLAPLSSASSYSEGITDPYTYNIEEAVKLLDEAGYKDIDGDGYRDDLNGKPMELVYVTYSTRPELKSLAEAFQNTLEKNLKIKVKLNITDSDTCYKLLGSGDYDVWAFNNNSLSTGDPENFFSGYLTKRTKDNQNYNTFNYDSKEFNSLITQLSSTFDTDKRLEIIKEAQQVLVNDAAAIYYCDPVMNMVSKNNGTGFESTPADYYWLTENIDKLNQ